MSHAVFPTFPDLKWGSTKTPIWSTKVQKAASGRELRAAYFSYPLWKFSLSYELLRANALAELQTLVDFFNARQGSFDSFLYEDPDDKFVTNQSFGIANPSQTQYQLVRDFGGYVEPVIASKGIPAISVGDVPKIAELDYTVSSATQFCMADLFTIKLPSGTAVLFSGRVSDVSGTRTEVECARLTGHLKLLMR